MLFYLRIKGDVKKGAKDLSQYL